MKPVVCVKKDEAVEAEISRLLQDDDVRLEKKYDAYVKRRINYLYNLRSRKKRGALLRSQGITEEYLDLLIAETDTEESVE